MHVYCKAVPEQHTSGDEPRSYTTSFPTFASSPHHSGGRLVEGRGRVSTDDVTGGPAACPGFEAGAFYLLFIALVLIQKQKK